MFSGMEAWSVFLSFLKRIFPNCSTADTTFNMPGEEKETLGSQPEGGATLKTQPWDCKLTDNLVVGEAHDVHGFHGLLEVLLILLTGDGDVTVGQEPVVVEAFEEQVG